MLHIKSALSGLIRRLAGDQRGIAAVVTAIALVVLMGFCGLAVDVVMWEANERAMQGAADQAALAGAAAFRSAGETGHLADSATAQNAAYATAIRSGYPASGVTVANYDNGATCTKHGCLKVTITQQQPRYFTAIFMSAGPTASASAVGTCQGCGNGAFAVSSGGGTACVMALDSSGKGVITASGNPVMSLNNCNLYNNSPQTNATILNGGAIIQGCTQTNACGSKALLAQPNTPSGSIDIPVVNNASPAPDPYAGLTAPTPSSPCQQFPSPPPSTGIPSGTYCPGNNINSSYNGGVVKFADNAVIIITGGLRVTGNGAVGFNGNGVFLYVTSDGSNSEQSNISANSTMNISAPTRGPYAGIATWFAGTSPVSWAGTNSSSFTGAIYSPEADVSYTGTAASASTCTRLVAASISLSGNTTATFDNSGCPALAGPVLTSSGTSGSLPYTGSPMLIQ